MTEADQEADPPSSPRRRIGLRGLVLDVAPLRLDRDYRWLWAGQALGGIGTQIVRVSLPFQVYVLTRDPLAIAGLAFAQLVPILFFSLGAGSIADAVDRRRLLVAVEIGMAAASFALFALALQPAPPLILIYAAAVAIAALSAVDQPARTSAIPRLVGPGRLPAAIALNQVVNQTGHIVGPALGGLLIGAAGVPAAYLFNVVAYGAAILALLRMRPIPPLTSAVRPGLGAIREGLRFAFRRRIILSAIVIDLNAMVFGMPTALFPVLALDVFRVGPQGLGLMAAAPAVGALLGALLSGWVSRVVQVGRAVVVSVVVWGLAIVGFGLATFSFPLALVLLAIAGAADVVSAVFRNLIVQLATPDELRGRITSIHVLSVTSGPRLGDIEAAAVASVIGAQLSVVSGGLLCLLGTVLVARAFPELRQHRIHPVSLPRGEPAAAGAG